MLQLPEPTDKHKNMERVWGGKNYESWEYNPINPNTLTYTRNLNTYICKLNYVKLYLSKIMCIGTRLPKPIKHLMIKALGHIPARVKDGELDLSTLRTLFAYRCVQCAALGEVYLHKKDPLDWPVIRVFLYLDIPHQTCGNFYRFEPKSKPIQYLYAAMTPNYKTMVLRYFHKLLYIADFTYYTTKSYNPVVISKVYNM